jgi:hypothetical protein
MHKMWTHAWVMSIPSFLMRWTRFMSLRHLSTPSLMPSSSPGPFTTTATAGRHVPRARRVPLVPPPAGTVTAAVAATEAVTQDGYAIDEGENEFEDENELEEDEVQQPAPGHPRQYNCNARPPPRPVRDDEHVAKLKLNIPPFEGRYNPDAYLTWELEVEQHFACLRYPEHLRVSAATCEFTDFASIWWSKHCRVNHANIPATWLSLKHAMRTRFVPPHYQRDLLKNWLV